jgi:endonuclease/exonuclease/phosphatase (EEP) superfamily protein YafD
VPSACGKFTLADGSELNLIATHPLPPIGAAYAAERNAQLQAVGEAAVDLDSPVIVAGDLNTTSWSPCFRDLLSTSQLRDSRRGWGIHPTWPGPLAALGIPIDHVLVSPEIEIVRRVVGPQIGSDHRPVLVDLSVPPATRRSPAVSPVK